MAAVKCRNKSIDRILFYQAGFLMRFILSGPYPYSPFSPPLMFDARASDWGNQKPRLCHFRFHYRFFTVPCVCVCFFVSSIHISVHHGSQHTSTHVKRLQGSGCRCNPECGERCRQSNTVETRKCKAFSGGLMVRSFSPRTTTTGPGGTMRSGEAFLPFDEFVGRRWQGTVCLGLVFMRKGLNISRHGADR